MCRPLVIILNKYTSEWGHNPVNFLGVQELRRLLAYLMPKHTVIYKRHTASGLEDYNDDKAVGSELVLRDKEMIRAEFPSVLLFEELAAGLPKTNDPEDENLLLFGLMALSDRFVTVQGGNAVVSSYFGARGLRPCRAAGGTEVGELPGTTSAPMDGGRAAPLVALKWSG